VQRWRWCLRGLPYGA